MEIKGDPKSVEGAPERVVRSSKTRIEYGSGITVGCNSLHNLPKRQNNT